MVAKQGKNSARLIDMYAREEPYVPVAKSFAAFSSRPVKNRHMPINHMRGALVCFLFIET
jgi:hypothetical protein